MFLLLSFYLLHPLGPAFSSTLLHIQFQAEKKKPKDEKKAFSIFVENLAAFPIFRGLKANQEGRGKKLQQKTVEQNKYCAVSDAETAPVKPNLI